MRRLQLFACVFLKAVILLCATVKVSNELLKLVLSFETLWSVSLLTAVAAVVVATGNYIV